MSPTRLHALYGGQQQGGISTRREPTFVRLFTGSESRYDYRDGWDEHGVFRCSGEGQVAHMESGPVPGR